MPKAKATFSVDSFGIYDGWDESSKKLPKIQTFTTDIPAHVGVEFGFVLRAIKAKNNKLTWTIFHPDIPDDSGDIMEPFQGEVYVGNNDWEFYLGDTIWEPVHNKVGDWRMLIELGNKVIANKTFSVEVEHGDGEIQFWKRRGY